MRKQTQLKNKPELRRTVVIFSILSILSMLNSTVVNAQSNNFFGTTAGAPGGLEPTNTSSSSNGADYSKDLPEDSNPNAVLPGLNETNPNNAAMGNDFSGDEKRMQKKYKANLASAKKLIEKGESMMNSSGKNVNNPEYKKGKILKETGEKWLASLKGNNPVPEQQKTK